MQPLRSGAHRRKQASSVPAGRLSRRPPRVERRLTASRVRPETTAQGGPVHGPGSLFRLDAPDAGTNTYVGTGTIYIGGTLTGLSIFGGQPESANPAGIITQGTEAWCIDWKPGFRRPARRRSRAWQRDAPSRRRPWRDADPANECGDAVLPEALFEGFDGPTELLLHVGGTTRRPLFGMANSCAAAA